MDSLEWAVVICFHFTIFVVLETTKWPHGLRRCRLWFAFILLSLSYWKQPAIISLSVSLSCDLLSFYYLCRIGNNTSSGTSAWTRLWFAFILLSLSYWKQLIIITLMNKVSCDLLSFYYLCRTGNNPCEMMKIARWVVICFHFTIFVVLETTRYNPTSWSCRCDLLSFYYLCRTGNNTSVAAVNVANVVICFHFTIFVVLETTRLQGDILSPSLWFAFILLSLSYWKQPMPRPYNTPQGCDLLSFYYLCRTGNNTKCKPWAWQCVVICFHFTIFVVLETTIFPLRLRDRMLWFAFILLSLSYWKQLGRRNCALSPCCDLLSFYYLCRTGNNVPPRWWPQ